MGLGVASWRQTKIKKCHYYFGLLWQLTIRGMLSYFVRGREDLCGLRRQSQIWSELSCTLSKQAKKVCRLLNSILFPFRCSLSCALSKQVKWICADGLFESCDLVMNKIKFCHLRLYPNNKIWVLNLNWSSIWTKHTGSVFNQQLLILLHIMSDYLCTCMLIW